MTSLVVHFCSAPLVCFVDALDSEGRDADHVFATARAEPRFAIHQEQLVSQGEAVVPQIGGSPGVDVEKSACPPQVPVLQTLHKRREVLATGQMENPPSSLSTV